MLLTDEMSRQPYPGILLWDTDLKELEKILDFMYFGEVKVKEDSLTSFLALADRLKVKGLCGKNSQNADEPEQQHQQYQEQKQKFQSKHSYQPHQQQQKQHFQSKHNYHPHQQQPQHISPPSEQQQGCVWSRFVYRLLLIIGRKKNLTVIWREKKIPIFIPTGWNWNIHSGGDKYIVYFRLL